MYKFYINLVAVLFYIFNGKPIVEGKDNLPTEPSIFAISHRSALDPFYIAIIAYPREIAFMGKDSLFKNKLLGALLSSGNVFPVNREKPSTKVIKHSINILTKENKYLGIFPTGSRYSTEIKSGTALIQKMSKTSIVPITIQPPLSVKEFFARKKAKIAIGTAIPFESDTKYTKEKLLKIDDLIATAFDQLDNQLDPNFSYQPSKK